MQEQQSIESPLNNEVYSTIYPNPTNGEASLNVLVFADTKMLVQLFKSDGAEIATLLNEVAKANTSYNFAINTANELSPGVYLVRMQTDAMTIVRKLIVKN